jgi:uncharacterized protein YcfJ
MVVGNEVGVLVRVVDGTAVGAIVGIVVGNEVGGDVGTLDGTAVGATVGMVVGNEVGVLVGVIDGTAVGAIYSGIMLSTISSRVSHQFSLALVSDTPSCSDQLFVAITIKFKSGETRINCPPNPLARKYLWPVFFPIHHK